MPPTCPTGKCEALEWAREQQTEQIEQLRQGQEALRLAMEKERGERDATATRVSTSAHRRMTALEVRIKDCEAVTKPWRSLLINVGTAAALAVAAYAKAKGWI